MKIALVHDHHEKQKLDDIKDMMEVLGPPTIRAVWMKCYNMWAALEGCHRLRAADLLGMIPDIVPVEYSDDPISSVLPEGDLVYIDYRISEIADHACLATALEFEG